ncbi:MAG: hypothetical protein WBL53_21575 [Pseudonocardiaceae bacterium]
MGTSVRSARPRHCPPCSPSVMVSGARWRPAATAEDLPPGHEPGRAGRQLSAVHRHEARTAETVARWAEDAVVAAAFVGAAARVNLRPAECERFPDAAPVPGEHVD